MASNKQSKKTKPNSAVKRRAADDSSPVTKKKPRTDKAGDQASEAMIKLIDSSAEDDESDEDDNASDKELQGITEVPKIPRHKKAAKRGGAEEPGTVYVGRIPHGFYEHQMKEYFSQFGPVNKLRLSRNRKTGASKHYAFIEFAEESTAEIVERTMNNYLLFNHILKVRVVPKDKIHPELWKGCNRRFKMVPRDKLMAQEFQKPRPESVWSNRASREDKRRTRKAKQLQEMDYEFEMPAVAPIPKPAADITAAEEEGVVLAIEAGPESKETTEPEGAAEKAIEEAVVETKKPEEPAPAKTPKSKRRRNVRSQA